MSVCGGDVTCVLHELGRGWVQKAHIEGRGARPQRRTREDTVHGGAQDLHLGCSQVMDTSFYSILPTVQMRDQNIARLIYQYCERSTETLLNAAFLTFDGLLKACH